MKPWALSGSEGAQVAGIAEHAGGLKHSLKGVQNARIPQQSDRQALSLVSICLHTAMKVLHAPQQASFEKEENPANQGAEGPLWHPHQRPAAWPAPCSSKGVHLDDSDADQCVQQRAPTSKH